MIRAITLLAFPFLSLSLSAENFYYVFTARVTAIQENEGAYLGTINAGDLLSGSFGVTDEVVAPFGGLRSIFLELQTPGANVRVDFPPLLYFWWREGHLELAWDNNGLIDLPWRLRQFALDLDGYSGTSSRDYLNQIKLEDFTSTTLTLEGVHQESGAAFNVLLELEELNPSETPPKQFFLDSGMQLFSNDPIRDLVMDRECIWLGGSGFYRPNGAQPLERLYLNGERDESFNIVGGFSNNDGTDPVIEQIEILADGDLFVVGHFSHYMHIAVGNYARLNPDGSLDPDFSKSRLGVGSPAGTDGRITAVQTLPDGRFLIGGDFDVVDGLPRAHLAMVEPYGEVVEAWYTVALASPDYFDAINDFALAPSGQTIYVAGGFSADIDGGVDGLLRLDLGDGTAESLAALNFPPSAFEQVALSVNGSLILREASGEGGQVVMHPDPDSGAGESLYLGERDELMVERIHSFTVLQDGRLFAVGEFEDLVHGRIFTQAVFSTEGHWLADSLGQPLQIDSFEVGSQLGKDGSIWIFGDFDLRLGTSDAVDPAWIYRFTKLARFCELAPAPSSSSVPILLGSTEASSPDNGTVYVSLLRTGHTELLDDRLGGYLEPVWSSIEHELNEWDDYVFPSMNREEFEFMPYDRMVSVPVSFLSDGELYHGDGTVGTAIFAPQYTGAPFSTSLSARTHIRIEVADSTQEQLEALQFYFPDAPVTSEAYIDPDEDGRDSKTEILMLTDPRFADQAPQPKLFRRLHPQDPDALWVLEFPFNGNIEQATFMVNQSLEDLSNWQLFEYNGSNLSGQRHRPFDERDSLIYGDPHGRGVIGLRLNPNNAESGFWNVTYFAH